VGRKIGRNAPCPCGSGRKYKQCCLRGARQAEQNDALAGRRRQRLLDLENTTVDLVLDWAREVMALDPVEVCPIDIEQPLNHGLVRTWAAYDHPVLDAFLEQEADLLTPEELRWLLAQKQAMIGVWEILETTPGASFRARNRLTDIERTVFERSASESLRRRDHLVGRVVDWEGESLLCGALPRVLPPRNADELVEMIRSVLREQHGLPARRPLRPEELRDPAIIATVLMAGEQLTDAMAARPPRLHNTDGEPILFTEDHYRLGPTGRSAALAAAGKLGERDEDAEDATFVVMRAGNAMHDHWDNTVTGRMVVSQQRVVLSTNSTARADQLRARFEALCPDVEHINRTEREPPRAPAEAAHPGPGPEVVPPPEIQELIREQLHTHSAAWPDMALPALEGRTPRQAMRTKSGRQKVERLLAQLEWHEERAPAWQRGAADRIRRALGLTPERR